jgi:hypothetical protein
MGPAARSTDAIRRAEELSQRRRVLAACWWIGSWTAQTSHTAATIGPKGATVAGASAGPVPSLPISLLSLVVSAEQSAIWADRVADTTLRTAQACVAEESRSGATIVGSAVHRVGGFAQIAIKCWVVGSGQRHRGIAVATENAAEAGIDGVATAEDSAVNFCATAIAGVFAVATPATPAPPVDPELPMAEFTVLEAPPIRSAAFASWRAVAPNNIVANITKEDFMTNSFYAQPSGSCKFIWLAGRNTRSFSLVLRKNVLWIHVSSRRQCPSPATRFSTILQNAWPTEVAKRIGHGYHGGNLVTDRYREPF